MQQERDAVILISPDEKVRSRFKQCCEYLLFDGHSFPSIEVFFKGDYSRPRSVIVDLREGVDEQDLQSVRETYPRAEILGIVKDASQPHLLAQKYLEISALEKTFLLEFYLYQSAFCEFYEVVPSDLFPETVVDFNAYHYLPLNQRYIPFVHKGLSLSEKRHRRLSEFRALYIHQKDSPSYIQYIERYFDRFSVGLKKRCRARAYQMLSAWRDYMLRLNYTSEKQKIVSATYPDFKNWMEDFIEYVKSSDNPWTMIFELSQIESFQFECSFLEAAIACYCSKMLGAGEIERVLNLKCLLGNQRLWQESLHYKKWWATGLSGFNEDERKIWASNFTLTKEAPRFKEASEGLQDDIATFHKQFIQGEEPVAEDATLIHLYWGEIIAMALLKMRKDEFSNKNLSEEVMVRCKSDGLLNEAWMTELRQFLLDGKKK